MSDLWIVFGIGLAGGVHCAGMCGGFVLALGLGSGRSGAGLAGLHAAYLLGKTATYALFGLAAGLFGHVLAEALAGMQHAFGLAVGLSLVVVGIGLVGGRRFQPSVGGSGRLSRLLGRVLRWPGAFGAFGLGLLNGVLPCGLVYAMLIQAAASGDALSGALTMTVFGLATVPALALVALGGRLARPAWRAKWARAGGALVIALGVLTMVRGLPDVHALMGHDEVHHSDMHQEHDHHGEPVHHLANE
ncbi:MAG: sulfite exporter TauE/SafE family protein [Bacteroidota bacterium]